MRRFPLLLLLILLAVTAFTAESTSAGGMTFIVNLNTDDDDLTGVDGVCDTAGTPGDGLQCTLRAAIEQANNTPDPDSVVFNIAGGGIQTITPASELPDIMQPLSIDGTTQPDCPSYPCIVLDGTGAGGFGRGLDVAGGAGTVIRGLVLRDWAGMAILLGGSGGHTVAGNYVGTDQAGMVDAGDGSGIFITSSGNTIGGPNAADRNVASGNEHGIHLGLNVLDNHILGNYIGIGADGSTPIANDFQGIRFSLVDEGAGRAFTGAGVGPNIVGPGNVVSGNTGQGICVCAGNDVTIIGNLVGTDATGQIAVPNGTNGIQIRGDGNTVGGDSAAERNVVSGNTEDGILIYNGPPPSMGQDNVVTGNFIGIAADGESALGNGIDGIEFFRATDAVVGGDSPGERNVVSTNNGYGILIYESPGATVMGNRVGTTADGEEGRGNQLEGIRLIGEDTTGALVEGNLSADNGTHGISIFTLASGNELHSNSIGLSVSGAPLGNTENGVHILGASDNTVGGLDKQANIIANNGGAGVYVTSIENLANGNTIRRNSVHTNNGPGIDLVSGANMAIEPPVLSAGAVSVTGTACANCIIDVFSDGEDEGRLYEGTTVADGGGSFEWDGPMTGPFTTATATDSNGNTSEFSTPVESPEQPTPTPTPEPTATPTPGPTATVTPTPTPGPTATAGPTETPGPSETPSDNVLQGDTDCDEDADSVDALFVLRDVAGFDPSKCIDQGDIDCDEDRDSVDALGILRHVADLPPLEQNEPCADIGTLV